jgi:hypothetical protein
LFGHRLSRILSWVKEFMINVHELIWRFMINFHELKCISNDWKLQIIVNSTSTGTVRFHLTERKDPLVRDNHRKRKPWLK